MSREEHEDYFVEDDSYEDDFDNKIDEKIKMHKRDIEEKEALRPESKYNRPESSKVAMSSKLRRDNEAVIQEEEQQLYHQNQAFNSNDYDFNNEPIPDDKQQRAKALEKLGEFVRREQIEIESFWKSNRIFVNVEQFRSFLLGVNYPVSTQEFEIIAKALINSEDQITIETLTKSLTPWKNQTDSMIEFLREKALQLATQSKKKFSVNNNPRAFSAKSVGKKGPQTLTLQKGYMMSTKTQKLRTETAESEVQQGMTSRMANHNKSSHYLKVFKKKEKEKEKLLQLTINRGKNEQEYESLIKMGEANEYLQKMGSCITYRAYKAADGNLRVHVYEVSEFRNELTLDEFQREYNNTRNQFFKKQNLKPWDLLNQPHSKNKAQHKKPFDEQRINIEEPTPHKQNKKDKQQTLRDTLFNTMMLTNVLKEQLQVLNSRGINGDAPPNYTVNSFASKNIYNSQNK